LRGFNFGGEESRFVVDFAHSVLLVGGALLVSLAAPALVIGGMETRTSELLLVHGVRRTELVLAQFAAITVALGWLTILAIVATAGVLGTLDRSIDTMTVIRVICGEFPPLLVVSAAAVLAAVISRTAILATSLTLVFAFAAHAAPVLAHARERSVGWGRAGWMALDALLPNFAHATANVAGIGYSLAYATVLLAGACVIFSHREF